MSADPNERDDRDETDERDEADEIELPDDAPEAVRDAVPKLHAAYGIEPKLSGDGLVTTNDRKLTAGTREGFKEARGVEIRQFDTPATVAVRDSPEVYEFTGGGKSVYVALSVADRLETMITNSIDALNAGNYFFINADMIEADRGYPVAVSLEQNPPTVPEEERETGLSDEQKNEPWALLPALADTDDLSTGGDRRPGEADTYTRQGLLTELKWREKYQQGQQPANSAGK